MHRSHILVVDDSANLRAALRIALEGLGFTVTDAPNGRVALERARRNMPDLVLIDLEMPVLNGWQLVGVLRRDFRTAGLPTLAMTARDDVTLEEAVDAGFCSLLRKPFTRADLLRAITRCAPRNEEPPDPRGALPPRPARRAA